ncbi:MAG: hypothetical protein AAFQ98_19585, partial [Bacteroidota bacterium]
MKNPLAASIKDHAKKIVGVAEGDELTEDNRRDLASRINLSQGTLDKLLDEDGERLTPLHIQNMALEAGYETVDDFTKVLQSEMGDKDFEFPFVSKQSIKLFVSYSHHPTDSACLERVRVHLAPLAKDGLDLWDDTKIKVGENWHESITHALNDA